MNEFSVDFIFATILAFKTNPQFIFHELTDP